MTQFNLLQIPVGQKALYLSVPPHPLYLLHQVCPIRLIQIVGATPMTIYVRIWIMMVRVSPEKLLTAENLTTIKIFRINFNPWRWPALGFLLYHGSLYKHKSHKTRNTSNLYHQIFVLCEDLICDKSTDWTNKLMCVK